MTFDDDMIRVEFDGGFKDFLCKENGIDWPPPEKLSFKGFNLERISFSTLTDEDRKSMTHVLRGAVYKPIEAKP